VDLLDEYTSEKLRQIINASHLSEFQRALLDYFFWDDRGRPSMKEFRQLTGLTLTNQEITSELTRLLAALRSSFATYRITRLSDVM
jgi:hypothetical protein